MSNVFRGYGDNLNSLYTQQNDIVYASSASANKSVASTITNVTGTHTVSEESQVIICTTSGAAYTITLPSPINNAGLYIKIYRTNTDLASKITISAADYFIDGVTEKFLCTEGETYELVSDDLNWVVLNHDAISPWYSEASGWQVVSLNGGTPPVKPTMVNDSMKWRRNGPDIEILGLWYNQVADGGSNPGTAGDYLIKIPKYEYLTMDSSIIHYTPGEGVGGWRCQGSAIGTVIASMMDGSYGNGHLIPFNNTSYRLFLHLTGATGVWGSDFYTITNSPKTMSLRASIPITEWR